jgi:hypothetical protein
VHAAALIALLVLGAWLRAANLGGPAFCCDELYDVLAAESWLAGGPLALPDGEPYTRGALLTLATAAAFALLGESEASARVPALLFGLATMPLAYAAGRLLFGRVAGLVALALVALSPDAVDVSRMARLYGPLTFLTLLAATAAYRVLEGRGEGLRLDSRRAGWLATAAAATLLGVHLHPAALAMGVVVQAYASVVAAGLALRGRWAAARPYAWLAAALLVLELAALAVPALRERLVAAALTPLPWYEPKPGDVWVYHAHLVAQYGWLWFLVWPATAVAVLGRPRPGLFAALAFWLPFAVISAVVPTKHPRYVIHLLPFAWLLIGAASEVIWGPLRAAALERLGRPAPAPAPAARAALWALVALALLPPIRLSPSVREALERPSRTTGRFASSIFHDWRGLARALGPSLPAEARVVAGTPLAPYYYLRRPTVLLIAAFRQRGEGDWETPERSSEGELQTADQLDALRRRGPVWVVVETWRWRKPGYFDAGLVAHVERTCEPIALPRGLSFVVHACRPLPEARDGRSTGRPPVPRLPAGP